MVSGNTTSVSNKRLCPPPPFDRSQLSFSPPPAAATAAIRRTSLLRERVRAAGRRCYSAVLVMSLLAAAIGGLRLLLADGSRGDWALYLFVVPGQVCVLGHWHSPTSRPNSTQHVHGICTVLCSQRSPLQSSLRRYAIPRVKHDGKLHDSCLTQVLPL